MGEESWKRSTPNDKQGEQWVWGEKRFKELRTPRPLRAWAGIQAKQEIYLIAAPFNEYRLPFKHQERD